MGDPLMNLCREAGEQLADPRCFPTLPSAVLTDNATKIELVTKTESHITNDIQISIPHIGSLSDLVERVREDARLNAAADVNLPGKPVNVAAGMAMRFYAGFLDMAKSLRFEEMQADGSKKVIDDTMRANYMNIVHERALRDDIYAAGARFGWWGVKRPGRSENVFDNGISDTYKKLYLADYYREYPPFADSSDF